MADLPHEALITGIGIVSCLGEGPEAHWQGLHDAEPKVDAINFTPYFVHRLAPLNFDKQIPKKGDQRQMEAWQRIGTYAAGLALDSAGIKGNAEILGRTDMIVAAGGGERDIGVDSAILSALPQAADPGTLLNERLMSDLRPTLFLAQLSNLLAGNISIVHGVTGSSRTFMGEESSGVDAMRIALARVEAGQSDIVLVGGSYNAERKDMLLSYAFGDYNLAGAFAPVWERGPTGGLVTGSLGAFLVLESRSHAQRRGASPFARLSAVMSERSEAVPAAALRRLWQALAARITSEAAVISGATGAEPVTSAERAWLAEQSLPVRATASHIGHAIEPQFPMNVALAALALRHGTLFPPLDRSGLEQPSEGRLSQVIVTGMGYRRGEGIALVEAAA